MHETPTPGDAPRTPQTDPPRTPQVDPAGTSQAERHSAQLEAVYDSMSDGLVVFDAAGQAVFVNRAEAELFGCSDPADLMSDLEGFAAIWELRELDGAVVPPEAWPVARVLRGETLTRWELVARRRDVGREWIVSYSGRPVFDADGRQTLAVVISRDITEDVRSRQALRESEARFRHLADAMPQLAWTARGDGTVDYYNSRAALYRGIEKEPEGVWTWNAVVHPDDREDTERAWREAVSQGTDYECEHRILMADGGWRWHLSRARRVVYGDGARARWFGTATDIHDVKEAETRLRHLADRLSEADRRKDEYLAMLGHELRNPLAAIHTATELVKMMIGGDARLARASDILSRQSRHMTRLIDGLLDVSRIAQGKIALDRTALDLRAISQEVIEDRKALIAAQGLEILEALPSEPVWIEGDRIRIAQILDNLLGNAVKFTPAPGRITVTLETADTDAVARDTAGTGAVLRVRDTGRGIRPQNLQEIFAPFHQEDADGSRVSDGLGLGLALCKGLVELHGGTIEARSEGPGRGAELVVRLPVAEAKAEGAEGETARAGAPRKVLVVEDNPDVAQTLSEVLELQGHRVAVADTGEQGLALLGREPFDVVLCDVGLPGMSGYDLARAVRDDARLGAPRLVAITGYGQSHDQARSAEAGFDVHLVKPVTLQALADVLDGAGPSGRRG